MDGEREAGDTDGPPPRPERRRRRTETPDADADTSRLGGARGRDTERGWEVAPPEIVREGNVEVWFLGFLENSAGGTAASMNVAGQQPSSQCNNNQEEHQDVLPVLNSTSFVPPEDNPAGGTAAPTNVVLQQTSSEWNNDKDDLQIFWPFLSSTSTSLVPPQQSLAQESAVQTGQHGWVIGEQVNPSQATRAVAATSMNNPASGAAAAAMMPLPQRSINTQLSDREPQYFLSQMLLQHGGHLPQHPLAPGPPPGTISPQPQIMPSSSRQLAETQMRLQHGGANRSIIPDAELSMARILKANARRALEQQGKATMHAQAQMRLQHGGAPGCNDFILSREQVEQGWAALVQKRRECERLTTQRNNLGRLLKQKTARVGRLEKQCANLRHEVLLLRQELKSEQEKKLQQRGVEAAQAQAPRVDLALPQAPQPDAEVALKCRDCLVRDATVLLKPCEHRSLCEFCFIHRRACPYCGQYTEE